jgi:ribitol 2-dehydrogenase
MARELEGKVAAVTGAASGIGLASTEAMLAAGSRVVMVDRDEAALSALCNKHGDAVIPLVVDLLDPKDCATLLPRILEKAGQLDILHANAGTYVGGDLVDADTGGHRPGHRELWRLLRALFKEADNIDGLID